VLTESGVTELGEIVNDSVVVAVPPTESVTVNTTEDVPAVVGVPEMAPVDESMLRPAGNPVADQV
jgi:hypothetical protein